MKRVPLLLGLILIASVVLAACGAKPDDKASNTLVEVVFWHTYNTDSAENKQLNEVVIPAFEAKNPGIKIKAVAMPYDGLHDQLIAAVSGGTQPDVMRMDIIWVPEFAKIGALAKLDALPEFAALKDKVFPGPLATNFYKGSYYGLPLNTNTQVMIYNKDMLAAVGAEPPKTIDDLKALGAKFKASDKQWAAAIGGPWAWQMLPWFWSAGGSITDDAYTKASGYLNSDASVAALQAIVDMYKAGTLGPTILPDGKPDTWGGFRENNYAVIADGPWFFGILGDDVKDKAVPALMPAGPNGSFSVVGGEDIVLFEGSKVKDAAWKFVQYMMSEEAQGAMAAVGVIPTLSSLADSDAVKDVWYLGPYLDQLQTALPRTPSPNWTKIDEILGRTFESVIRGQAETKAALDAAAQEIDALLADN